VIQHWHGNHQRDFGAFEGGFSRLGAEWAGFGRHRLVTGQREGLRISVHAWAGVEDRGSFKSEMFWEVKFSLGVEVMDQEWTAKARAGRVAFYSSELGFNIPLGVVRNNRH
jgi:hypothetical protein